MWIDFFFYSCQGFWEMGDIFKYETVVLKLWCWMAIFQNISGLEPMKLGTLKKVYCYIAYFCEYFEYIFYIPHTVQMAFGDIVIVQSYHEWYNQLCWMVSDFQRLKFLNLC